MSGLHIRLREWQRLGPEEDRRLSGWTFGSDDASRTLAVELAEAGRVELLEFVRGLEVRATSFVGRLQLGELTVTIEPKLPDAPFLTLLSYAYGLRHLDLHKGTGYATQQRTFVDLLIHQLASEVEEIVRRGVHRDYVRREVDLASPRGRLDFRRIPANWGRGTASLSCIDYPRTEDNELNQALLAGLNHASRLTSDLPLRAKAWRLMAGLGEHVSEKSLSFHLVEEARAKLDRRTRAYESSLTLIELLLAGDGAALDDAAPRVQLPGFLFDMNLFFQRLISRFLRENLEGFEVEDEGRIKELFRYDPARNPQQRRAPVQKPDFLIWRGSKVAAVLDAKYRDLWETSFPRDMLYQLALYALGRSGDERGAAIIYPTTNDTAREQAVLLRHPRTGCINGEVVLRPLNLLRLAEQLSEETPGARAQRHQIARRLAFGVSAVGAGPASVAR